MERKSLNEMKQILYSETNLGLLALRAYIKSIAFFFNCLSLRVIKGTKIFSNVLIPTFQHR